MLYPERDLGFAWRKVLFNQMHDILPGSGIAPIYEDALDFYDHARGRIEPNVLTLRVQPDEGITLTFQTKMPGAKVCLNPVTMDFDYGSVRQGVPLDAYEKAILDCLLGEHTLYVRKDAVELCWAFLSPVLEACETCPNPEANLHLYEAGTRGPPQAKKMIDG